MGLRADGMDGHPLRLKRADQVAELLELPRLLQPEVIVTKDRFRIRLVRVLKCLGDVVRPDDLIPQAVAQQFV